MSTTNPINEAEQSTTTHYELSNRSGENLRPATVRASSQEGIANLNQQLDQVKQITVNNIEKVLERGERIDMLVDSTERLQQSSHQFHRQSNRLARAMRWRKYRCYLMVVLLAVLAIYVFAWMICGNGTLKNCG